MKSATRLTAVIVCFGLALSACAGTVPAGDAPPSVVQACDDAPDCYTVPVGSSAIGVARLSSYHAVWVQRGLKDGEWVDAGGRFEERLETGEDGHWRHLQIMRPGDGTTISGTRLLARNSLRVLREIVEFENRPAEHPAKIDYDLSGDRYHADLTFANGDTKQGQPNELAFPMFDGQILGVALAALPLREGYTATLPAVIAHMSAAYRVEASVTARTRVQAVDGTTVDVWEVGTKWIDLDNKGVSEAGRDESGGAYYIAVQAGDGVPHVVEYVNNGGSILWDGVRRSAR